MDRLPELVLHKIFLKSDYDSITSLQTTCKNFRHVINKYRYWYSQQDVAHLIIEKTCDDRRYILVSYDEDTIDGAKKKFVPGSLKDAICGLNPLHFVGYDHEELAKIHPAWWRKVESIRLTEVVSCEPYTKQFNGCNHVSVESLKKLKMGDIIKNMKSKSLEVFRVNGAALECTDADLLKLSQVSNNLRRLFLTTLSPKSKHSNDAILDLMTSGCFEHHGNVYIPLSGNRLKDFERCLARRNVLDYTFFEGNKIYIEFTDDFACFVVYRQFGDNV